jgi:16S rRNA processing protein RimM
VTTVDIGFVLRAHGIRGEIHVTCHDPASTSLSRARAIYLDGRRHDLIAARPIDGGWLLAISGVGDRDAAEALRGTAIAVDREAVGLTSGDILLADLVGCEVRLADDSPWGHVAAVACGPQDLLVVHDGDVERLVPLVDEIVVDIDLEARRIVVDPPDGLPETAR